MQNLIINIASMIRLAFLIFLFIDHSQGKAEVNIGNDAHVDNNVRNSEH